MAKRLKLSKRLYEVLWHIVDGKSDREIGEALGVTRATASYHAARLRRLFGVKSRQELVREAIAGKYVKPWVGTKIEEEGVKERVQTN